MGYLTPHCQKEKHDEVDQKYWPEHGNIKELEKGHKGAHNNSIKAAVPKFKLWNPSTKWSKLFTLCR